MVKKQQHKVKKKRLKQIKKEIKISEEELKKQQEAKYISDCETLDKINKPCTEQDLLLLKVLPENYRKWKEQKDKQELLQKIKGYINKWITNWNIDRANCLDELNKLSQEQKDFTKTELKNWLEDELRKKKEEDKSKEREKRIQETEVKDASKVFSKKGQGEFFSQLQPIFYDKSGMFWLWNNKTCSWELSDDIDILNIIEESTGEDIIDSTRRTEIINTLKQEGRKNIPQPFKKTWIQFQDEIIDITNGEKIKATPEYFATNPIPYKLHNNNYEQTPAIDKIFEEWVGKDYVQTLHEIIAYCLLPDYPIHRLFCFVGSGMNGKSKFLELLRKFVGEKNCCSTELDTLISSRFEITRLHKKLLCQMGETNFNEMSRTSIIKKLTGGDLIGFEYKNKNPFEERNYAKIIIATNNLPTTTDKTIGFYRRWLIIDFPNQFSEQKDILLEIPEEEYESLALKCVGILGDLLKERKFHKEGTIEERMEKYEAKSDFLQKFLDEFTEQEPNSDITKNDFYKKFTEWCIENRHRQMAESTLGKKMKEKCIEAGRRHVDWLFEGKGGQIYVWLGIKWRN